MNNLSVILTNYNHAQFLVESLPAILNQSHKANEIIIVDDASTDMSIEVIQEFQKKHPEIILVRHPQNRGVHAAINTGIAASKGELIALLAADDIIQDGLFEKSLQILNAHPEIALTCTDYSQFYDEKPYAFQNISYLPTNETKIFQPNELISIVKTSGFEIASNTCIYRKEHVLRYGSYNTKELASMIDFYLNAVIAFKHPIAYIPLRLGAFRLTTNSYGSSVRFAFKKRYRAQQKLLALIQEDDGLRSAFKKSGLLSCGGYFMVLFLALHPRYWSYLPITSYVVIKKKLNLFQRKLTISAIPQ